MSSGVQLEKAITESYPLSPTQQGMLFHSLSAPAPGVDLVQVICSLHENLDPVAFARAWQRVVERHAILRSGFGRRGSGQPRQEVHSFAEIVVPRQNWRELPHGEQEARFEAWLRADAVRPFDLSQPPLMRLALFELGQEEHQFVWTFHHLLLDGRALNLVLTEVFAFYEAFGRLEDLELPPPRPYRSYIDWLAQQDFSRAESFWRRTLQGFTAPTVPLIPRSLHGHIEPGDVHGRQELRLGKEVTGALRALATEHQLTLNAILQGAWALLLSRYCGEEDVLFGAIRACRRSTVPGAESIVGPFINSVPRRVGVDPQKPLLPWLGELRSSWLALRPWEHTPLVDIQGWSEVPRNQPLFETIFNFQEPSWETVLQGQGGKWSSRQFSIRNHPSYPLAVDAYGGDDLLIRLLFHRNRFDDATIVRMLGHFKTLLESIAANPHRRLYELPLLAAAERHQLLVEWNDTCADFPKDKCVHQLVEEQVERTPDALAVKGGKEQLTYAELNRRAARLAGRLQRRGVGPEVRVGVCLERSVDLVVALLAILKAGGAYVPLDTASPRERLNFMIENAHVPILITEENAKEASRLLSGHFRGAFKSVDLEIICVEDEEKGSTQGPAAASPTALRALHPGNLAYVIYTSGSTGTPKGVEIEHASLINLITWHRRAYRLTSADRATQLAAPAFDASVWEIWPYLASGASVHIPEEEIRSSPAKLKAWLAANKITVSFIPTPLVEAMFDGPWPECPNLRAVLTGGDKLNRPPPLEFPCALINHYGPTEGTVVTTCTAVPATAHPATVPTIGRPIHNTQVYILDRHLQPVPIGVPGELHISGAGLARGYLDAPELTAKKFVPNPFSQDRTARLYKTGDAVRWLPDGRIEFLGRIDQQVKIHGNRIELDEIEFVLNRHPAVRQATVVARESEGEDKRLVAYVVYKAEAPESAPTYSVEEPDLLVKGREHFPIDSLSLHGPADALLPNLVETGVQPKETQPQAVGLADACLGARGRIALAPDRSLDCPTKMESRVAPADVLCLPIAESMTTLRRQVREGELRDYLKRTLPDWMIPTAFVFLNALPRTASGKVDRKALPAPTLDPVCPQAPARSATEQSLVRIWCDVLGLKGVGTRDDFFRLGGHSLLATQVMSRVWDTFQVEVPLQDLFDAPTIFGLAERIENALGVSGAPFPGHSQPAVGPGADQAAGVSVGCLPSNTAEKAGPAFARISQKGESLLSFAQERLWFLEQMEPGVAFNNIPFAFRLEGALNPAALEQALDEMVRRHETFRTVFRKRNGRPLAIIEPARPFTMLVFDLSALPPTEREANATRLATEAARRPFDLSRSPLLRARLIRLSADEHLLVLVTHHVACDGWSLGVFHRELSLLYQAFAEELPSALAPLPFNYADFSQWQRQWLRGPLLDDQLAYWKHQLEGAPVAVELPTDRPRPPVQSYRGAVRHFTLPAALSNDLAQLSQSEGVTPFMLFLSAFQTLLHRYSGQDDILVGSPIAGRTRVETENLIGVFLNMLVLRGTLSGDPTFRELLKRVRKTALEAYAHQDVPFEKLVDALQPQRDLSRSPLVQVMFVLHNQPLHPLELAGLNLQAVPLHNGTAKFDLTLSLEDHGQGLSGFVEYNTDLFAEQTVIRMIGHFEELLKGLVANVDQRLSALPLLTGAERHQLLADWNKTGAEFPKEKCIHECFAEQVERTPKAVAVVFEHEQLTYRELDERANQLAGELRALGVGPEVRVGLCVERSLEMMVGLLGILKAGGCYVPLDPTYPMERLTFMLEDSQIPVLLTQERLQADFHFEVLNPKVLCLDAPRFRCSTLPQSLAATTRLTADNLAYVIYTSGSTGTPKGVMVTHRNVINFFGAMDRTVVGDPGVWLAVTSISFDISVLELFWTLTRGFKVVIQGNHNVTSSASGRRRAPGQVTDFSLFYFASDASNPAQDSYRLLLEGARFADRHGFAAVWTPERHFHAFGGLYPNPSVTSAALAMITDRIQIRAGSVVLPLHHPLRVAEEWAVVDNLSNGRVAISFASGWNANDFALAPEHYADRQEVLSRGIQMVRKLWRGESIKVRNGAGAEVDLGILPRPVQPELPFWMTAAGNPETFRKAGEIGANLLTHLLGQTLEELSQKIALYRAAWRENHHPGEGRVTLMLHTFVGHDMASVRSKVRGPFCDYLKTSVDLIRKACSTETSSAFGPRSRDAAKPSAAALAPIALKEDDMNAMVAHAFDRYFESSGLFGTPEVCLKRIEEVRAVGVNEVACLIDFGVEAEAVLGSLSLLNEVKERSNQGSIHETRSPDSFSITDQIRRHGVTHLQCTPSLAAALVQDPEACRALGSLKKLLLGGEALPSSLASQLQQLISGELLNMYGPTETTVWSTTHRVGKVNGSVPIGRPIANTEIYIVDRNSQLVPIGVPGELLIGGAGVARGYQNRPELSVERFIAHPFSSDPQARLYRTGDLARYQSEGQIEFMGRMDQQVKVRGHRIELGEIEATLTQHPAVRECVSAMIEEPPGEKRLAAYVVSDPGQPGTSPNELRAFLQAKLPDYMIPSAFVLLEALPLTPNGKLNRRALPAPVLQRAESGTTFTAPSTPTERALAKIWCEVLGLQQVGVNENFFELGGHSLLIMQVISRVREAFEVDLPMRRFFEAPVIAGLASTIQDLLVDKIYELPEEEANRLAIGQVAS